MASFTDEILHFNNYVQQLPVEAMIEVERFKQQKYDMGIQAIEQTRDSIAGLPVDSKYSSYVNSALTEFNNGIRKVAGADFSNTQLINQIENSANQIASDPIVQSGVISAQVNRENLDRIKEDKKNGKLSPDNESFYFKQYSEWKQNPDLSTPFGGTYYTHYDINKRINDDIAAAHVDKSEFDDFPKDENGEPIIDAGVLIRRSKEGMLSSKVQSIVNNIFQDPQVANQLNITGWYQYRGYGPDQLKNIQQQNVDYLQEQVDDLNSRMSLEKQLSSADQAKYTQAISSANQRLVDAKSKYKSFSDLIDRGNVDAARTQLYSENVMQSAINNKSWETNSSKVELSPYFDAQMKRATYEFGVAKEQFDEADANRKYDRGVYEFDMTYSQKERELQIKQQGEATKANKTGAGGTETVYDPAGIPGDVAEGLGSGTFEQQRENLNTQRLQVFAGITESIDGNYKGIPYSELFIKGADGTWGYNPQHRRDPNYVQAYKNVVAILNKQYNDGTLKNDYKGAASVYYNLTSLVQQQDQAAADLETRYKPDVAKMASIIGNVQAFVQTSATGDKIPISSADMVNYWLWTNSSSDLAQQSAKKSLTDKYGDSLQFFIDQVQTGVNEFNPSAGGKTAEIYKRFREHAEKNPNFASLLDRREQDYKNLQGQLNYNTATFIPSKPEELKTVNTLFSKAFAFLSDDQKAKGDYSDLPEWLNASKEGNLGANTYSAYTDNAGQNHLVVKRNTGDKFETRDFPVTPEVFNQLKIFNDPKENQFNLTVQPFLNLYNNRSTTKDVNSDAAAVNSLERRNIGKYSVGFQFKALNGGFVPYLYITDTKTGNRQNAVEYNPAVLASLPNISPQVRQLIQDNASSVISKQDLLDKIRDNTIFTEEFITALMKYNGR